MSPGEVGLFTDHRCDIAACIERLRKVDSQEINQSITRVLSCCEEALSKTVMIIRVHVR